MQERRKSITETNAGSYEATKASHASVEGIGLAMRVLQENNYDFSKVANPLTFTIGEAEATVEIDHFKNSQLRYNQINLTSVGTFEDKTDTSRSLFTSNYPTPTGAMGFYGNNDVDLQTSGDKFSISGNDASGQKSSVSGLATKGTNSYNTLSNSIDSKEADNITGSGGTPSLNHERHMDSTGLKSKLDDWKSNADNVIGEDGIEGAETDTLNGATLGTESSPEITVVKDSAILRGGTTGYGIMVVENGAKLDFGSNTEFNGLIINTSQEQNYRAKGTPNVNGAMMSIPECGLSASDCQTKLDFGGGLQLNYNSDVLYNMQTGLTPDKMDYKYTQDQMYN